MNSIAYGVGGFTVLLGAAVLIAILAERVRVPAAVALVGIGAFFQIPPPFAFGDTLLFVFLPPLIFEASWNLDLDSLRKNAWRIAGLAFPGTIATAAIVAAGVVLVGALPLGAAMLLGAILSATDPVAVVAAFRRVAVPLDLKTIVEAESLSNDGVALVMFGFTVAIAAGAQASVVADIARGTVAVVCGTLIGAVAGVLCAGVLRTTRAPEHEVTVTVVLAYSAYVAATAAQCSGIFATAAGAIALRAALRRVPSVLTHADDVDIVWRAFAFVANAVVFLATGLVIRPERIVNEPVLVIAAIVAVTLARVSLALIATGSPAARITVYLAGMRGAMPLALALSLPDTLPLRPQIIDATFAVVLFTIVVQGTPLELVLARLYRSEPKGTPS